MLGNRHLARFFLKGMNHHGLLGRRSLKLAAAKMKQTFKNDWERVLELACNYANYIDANDHVLARRVNGEMLAELDRLRGIHGDNPRILATIADYTKDVNVKLSLLSDAFEAHVERMETEDAMACATSALRYSREAGRLEQAALWRERVSSLISHVRDEWEISEATKLLEEPPRRSGIEGR